MYKEKRNYPFLILFGCQCFESTQFGADYQSEDISMRKEKKNKLQILVIKREGEMKE